MVFQDHNLAVKMLMAHYFWASSVDSDIKIFKSRKSPLKETFYYKIIQIQKNIHFEHKISLN